MNTDNFTHDLPEGWAETDLTSLAFRIVDGSHNPPKKADSGNPMISAKDIFNGEINLNNTRLVNENDFKREHQRTAISTGDVLLTIVGSIGRSAVVPPDLPPFTAQRSVAVIKLAKIVPAFIRYQLEAPRVQEMLRDLASGTAQKGVYLRTLSRLPIHVAPLIEQKRIVTKLEELLSGVAKAKSHLDRVSQTVESFRRAVLDAAFPGRPTEDWRIGKNAKDWAETSVKDVTTKIQYGYTASSEKNIEGPRFLRITDIQKGKVNWDEVPSCKIDKRHIIKYQLETGDIVFARTGATTGKSFLIKECPLSIFASYLIRLKPDKKKILPEYLYIFFQSDSYWEQIAGKLSGSAQPNCNATKLSNLELFLPSLLEQAEIADLVEMLFELSDKVEVRIKEAREKIVKLTHSILAKAFKGELVPTEAELARQEGRTYETAKQLLARIKLEREKKRTLEVKVSGEIKVRSKVMGAIKGSKKRPLLEVLTETKGKLKPEQLFQKASFTKEIVDDFYEELREAVQAGLIKELRPKKTEIYLEAVKT